MKKDDFLIFEAYKKGKHEKDKRKHEKSDYFEDVCNCTDEEACEPCKRKLSKSLKKK